MYGKSATSGSPVHSFGSSTFKACMPFVKRGSLLFRHSRRAPRVARLASQVCNPAGISSRRFHKTRRNHSGDNQASGRVEPTQVYADSYVEHAARGESVGTHRLL